MTPTTTAILIVATHFIVDWMLQSRYEATNKSKRPLVLARHLAVNALGFAWVLLLDVSPGALFLNTWSHGVIDWNIWRLYAWARRHRPPEFMEKNLYAQDYWFYFTIAVDQLLHLTIALWLFMPNK